MHGRLSLNTRAATYRRRMLLVTAKLEVHAQNPNTPVAERLTMRSAGSTLSSKTHLNIRHDKRHNFILHTLSHQAQTGASCHGDVPYTLVSVLTRLLFGELLQQHAY